MAIVKAKCPNCGKIIDIEEEEFNVMCKFCGVPFMPKEGIEEYSRHISDIVNNLNVDTLNVTADNIANYATLGLASLSEKNHEKCGFYADDILKRNPHSPEGLLLKAFFVSNNYSKEEGIRYYFLAFNNSSDPQLSEKILQTLKDEFTEYSADNFQFLLQEMTSKHQSAHPELFRYILCYLSSAVDEVPLIEQVQIERATVEDYLHTAAKVTFETEGRTFVDDGTTLFVYAFGKLLKAVDFTLIDQEIEKFFSKKSEGSVTYNAYFGTRILELHFQKASPELESVFAEHQRTLSEIRSGCYIATCVYGSYYHPNVRVLRRYRDDRLAETCAGRMLIRCYYAISPSLVKCFGGTRWFQGLFRRFLDDKVRRLKREGISSGPYKDGSKERKRADNG